MVAACAAFAGCVDARKSFDDYSTHVVDSNTSLPDHPVLNKIPDATGHFFIGVHIAAAGNSPPILLVSDWKVVDNGDGTAKVSYSASALTAASPHVISAGDPSTPQPSVPPQFSATDMPTGTDGTFMAALAGWVPGDANPISVGTAVQADAQMHAVVMSKDVICGTLTGTALVDLSGSTFAAIRIPDGEIGAALPTPVTACP